MRTFGVTIVGLYQTLRGLIGLIFGGFILFFEGPANKMASVSASGNIVERMLGQLGHRAGIIVIAFALVHLLAGYGLWLVRKWGRLLTILVSAIELVLMLPSALQVNTFALCFAALNAVCILYLAMPPVRRTFLGTGGRLQSA
ncbi:MAG: DUF2127 domain-containing protein [Terriglobales bacterium]|jgi:hypothetical protein